MSTASGAVAGTPGDIFRLLRDGAATSRSALARATGLAPSTVSLRVESLLRRGLVDEVGDEESRGGRRARRLHVNAEAGVVVGADVGSHHVRVGAADLLGQRIVTVEHPLDVAAGPAVVVPRLWELVTATVAASGRDPARIMGFALGLPAPIDAASGRVVLPSGMPGWHLVDVAAAFAEHTPVPVLVENDANLAAVAEFGAVAVDHLLAVKLGTRIGCGIVSEGRLHRGAGGAAGEISHVTVPGEAAIPCSCSVPNCLESVAGGGALVHRLRESGFAVERPSDVVDLAAHGEVSAVQALREAGNLIGEVLTSVVNFFNPRVVALSGAMSAAEPLVAAVRATLFARCLPLTAAVLEVRAGSAGADSGLSGALRLVADRVLAPARIDALVLS